MNSGYGCVTAFLMIVLALGLGACGGEERAAWQVYESEPAGEVEAPGDKAEADAVRS